MNQQRSNQIEQRLGLDRSSGRNRRLKIWAGIVIVLLAVISASPIFFSKNTDSTVRYKTKAAERRDLTITATG